MSVANFEFKVVVGGPFGAGKSTMISNLSNVPVVGTEVPTRGEEAESKESTTVGVEYGTFDAETDEFALHLLVYGTPGQARFRFMWPVVSEGADAAVVLVDATDRSSWAAARELVDFFEYEQEIPFVVGANRGIGQPDQVSWMAMHLRVPPEVPIIPCDVTNGDSARGLVVAAFDRLLAQLAASEAADV